MRLVEFVRQGKGKKGKVIFQDLTPFCLTHLFEIVLILIGSMPIRLAQVNKGYLFDTDTIFSHAMLCLKKPS